MTKKKIKRWRVGDGKWVDAVDAHVMDNYGVDWLVESRVNVLPLAAVEIEYEEPVPVFNEDGTCSNACSFVVDGASSHRGVFFIECERHGSMGHGHHLCPDAVVLKSEVE